MKILLLVNPAAGRKQGKATAAQALKLFQDKGISAEARYSEFSGHLFQLAESAVTEPWDAIVAVGGDGTLFEIINGMLAGDPGLPIPLGIIPVGTGNSFSRDLNIGGLDTAVAKIVRAKVRKVDLGQYESSEGTRVFINILGFGFVADVANEAHKHKRWGALSYVIGVLVITARLESYSLEMEIDGQKFTRDNCFVEISNSTKTGGDMLMAPQALIDDGFLDVIILNKISRIGLLKAFPKIFKGTHVNLPEVEVFKAKNISMKTNSPKILTPDGEIRGTTPLRVTVLPQKLQVLD
jgi:YegS/Rv2252/BmrU family lipid kinase